jgi:hypothetical protein
VTSLGDSRSRGKHDCPRCGSARSKVENGPHISTRWCSDCGNLLGTTTPNGEPGAYRLRFGKHAGKTLADLGSTLAGRGYIVWLAANVSNEAGRQAQAFLELASAEAVAR